MRAMAVRRAVAKSTLGRIRSLPYETKISFETMPYPHYAYGTYYAALQAKALGLNEISVIEFGVAAGNGLLALEKIALEVEATTGVGVRSYGLLLEECTPATADLDRSAPRLRWTELMVGDVVETVGAFAADESVSPVGFVGFSLDYPSTTSAFEHLELANARFLPRTYCYFDDNIGDDGELHSQLACERLQISEFNGGSERRRLAKIDGLGRSRVFRSRWQEAMCVLHSFDHPEYNRYVIPRCDEWERALVKV